MSHLGLQRKVQKLLSSRVRVDSPEMTTALKGLSELFPQSQGYEVLLHRGQLRSSLERQGVQFNEQLVGAFGDVQTQLALLDSSISQLALACTSVTARLQEAREGTAQLLQKTSALQNEQACVIRKRCVVATFLQRFQLSEEERRALESDDVDDAFFDALKRIGEIRADCKDLLQNYHQRVGLDIMDSLAQRLERGYEKLYRWVQKEAREMQHHVEVRVTFARALNLLRAMPVYYQHCSQEIAQTRRLLLIRRFLAALTRGGVDGTPRPIEMNAHDPVRYVGDMCAWVHQAAASEMDFFRTVLCVDSEDAAAQSASAGRPSDNSTATMDEIDPASRVTIETLTADVMAGVSRPLKARVTQSLASNRDVLTIYKLCNVLNFYRDSIHALLFSASPPAEAAAAVVSAANPQTVSPRGSDTQSSVSRGSDPQTPSSASAANTDHIGETMQELCTTARDNFFLVTSEEARKLSTNPPMAPRDLTPCRAVTQTTGELQQILDLTVSSLTAFDETSFEKTVAAVLDPVLAAAEKGAKDLGESEKAVYMINVWDAVRSCLSKTKLSLARVRSELLALQIQHNADLLVGSQVRSVLKKCGLDIIVATIVQRDNAAASAAADPPAPPSARGKAPLSSLARMDLKSLGDLLQAFYSIAMSLPALPHCDRILNANLRRATRDSISQRVSASYRYVYGSLVDPVGGGYPPNELAAVLVHTPAQIDTLLNVNETRGTLFSPAH